MLGCIPQEPKCWVWVGNFEFWTSRCGFVLVSHGSVLQTLIGSLRLCMSCCWLQRFCLPAGLLDPTSNEIRMSFWSESRREGGQRKKWGRTWGQKSEAQCGGFLETLCFYPTMKLFVLNKAKRSSEAFRVRTEMCLCTCMYLCLLTCMCVHALCSG